MKSDSSTQNLSTSSPNGDHLVQFYEEDGFLVDSVSEYLVGGLREGHGVVVIATAKHRTALSQRLAAEGINLQVETDQGRYVALDAAKTLAKFMSQGAPDAALFRQVVGKVVEEAGKGRNGVRAFGEMVALLWAEGNKAGAIRLEQLWNDLAATHSFSLLCAYPVKGFHEADDHKAFGHICDTHSRVVPSETYFVANGDERLREVAALQQKAVALEAEIARREQAEQALRRREAELTEFVENASLGLHWVGPDGMIKWANSADYGLLGYNREEYVGRHIAEFHADADVIEDILARLTRGERLRDYEARLKCKDGSIRTVLIDSSVLRENGKFVHTQCFTRDVTEKKRTEDALRKSEERLRQLVSLMPAAVYTCDASGRITYFNRRAAQLWGREPAIETTEEKFCGSFQLRLPDGKPLPHDQTPMALAVREGQPSRDREVVIERSDGSRVTVSVNIDPLVDTEGKLAGAINVFQDISHLKRVEQELRTRQEHLQAVIENTPECVKIVAADGTLLAMNTAGLCMVEADSAPHVIGKNIYDVIAPEFREAFQRMNERVCAGSKENLEFQIMGLKGTRRWMETHAAPIVDSGSGRTAQLAVTRDVTERKRGEELLRRREERLQLLSDTLAQLLAARDPDTLVRELFPKVAAHLGVDTYFNFMVNKVGDALTLHSCAGIPAETARAIERLEFGQAICGTVAQTRQAIHATDIQHSDYDKAALVRSFGIQCYACNPLLVGDRLLGTLSFASRTRKAFHEDELQFLRIVSQYTAVALDRLRSAEILRQSEERFRAVLDNSGAVIYVKDCEGRYLLINEQYARLFHTTQEAFVGKTDFALFPTETAQRFRQNDLEVIRTGKVVEVEEVAPHEDGLHTYISMKFPLRRSDGEIYAVGGISTDITERKRAESLLLGQKEALQLIAEDAPLLTIMEKLVKVIERHSPGLMGSVLLLEEDRVHLRPFAGSRVPEGWTKLITPLAVGPSVGSCGTAAYRNEPVICEDIAVDPLWTGFKEVALSFGLRACWSTPIRSSDGAVLGTFACYYREPRRPIDLEWKVVEILSQTAALAIERQQAREARQKFTALVEHSPNFIGVADLNQRAVFVNAAGRELMGLAPDQVGQTRILDYFPEDERQRVQRDILPLLMEKKHWDGEVTFQNFKTGARIPMMWNVFLIPDPKTEQPAFFACVSTDITERKQAESLLDAQKDSMEMLVRGAPLHEVLSSLARIVEQQCEGKAISSILLLDEEGRLHNGASPGLPEHYLQAIDGLKVRADLGTCSRAAATKECVITPDIDADPGWQSIKHLPLGLGFRAAWSMPILAKSGRVLGTFGTYFRECREPSPLERQIVEVLSRTASLAIEGKMAEHALRQSEEQFRTLAEALPPIVWTARPDGYIDYYNKRWYEYTGFPEGEFGDESWKPILHPDDVQRCVDTYFSCIREERPYQIEYRFVDRQSGGYRWFLGRALPLRDESGKIIRWFGTCTDIDDQKRAEEKLERAVAERTASLREAISQMEEFSYTVSHDLRAPLRGMQVYTEALAQDFAADLPAEARRYLDRIATNANRLDRMILDVLTFSRIARAELRLERVETERLVRQIVEQYPDMHPPGANVRIARLHDVLGHEPSLTQALSNLLHNAVKFVAPGVKPEISVWSEHQNSHVRLWVADNGIGVAPKYQHRLFSMFERIHPDLKYEGTGVGLAIVRKAVERMGGKVGVESDGVSGSRFWIELRAVQAS